MEESLKDLSKSRTQISNTNIYNLPVKEYELISPIDVTLEFHQDEVLAIIPDLEIYGEGNNQIEAINDLKLELIDLFEHLEEEPDEKLGEQAFAWKKTLKSLIKLCK